MLACLSVRPICENDAFRQNLPRWRKTQQHFPQRVSDDRRYLGIRGLPAGQKDSCVQDAAVRFTLGADMALFGRRRRGGSIRLGGSGGGLAAASTEQTT